MKKLVLFILIFIIITISGNSHTLSIDKNDSPLDLDGLSLGDSYKEVIAVLGSDYKEELVIDESGYIGEDFYFWYYDDVRAMIGKESKELINIVISSEDIETALGVKIGDKAEDVLSIYREKYDELVSIHTDKPVTGWFMVSNDMVLIFDFEKDDLSRVNDNIDPNDEVIVIELAYIKHFD